MLRSRLVWRPEVWPRSAGRRRRCGGHGAGHPPGVDAISVIADVLDVTRGSIAVAERQLLLADACRRLQGHGAASEHGWGP